METNGGSNSTADLFSRVLRGAEHTTPGGSSSSSNSSVAVGGFLVCLDVPSATEFGVDYEVFRTGPKFQGVKFLPLGIHFVLFRSREQEHGIRQGFFINVERHAQTVVREWSMEKEELGPPRPGLNVENLQRTTDWSNDAAVGDIIDAIIHTLLLLLLQAPCCRSSLTAGWGRIRSSI